MKTVYGRITSTQSSLTGFKFNARGKVYHIVHLFGRINELLMI